MYYFGTFLLFIGLTNLAESLGPTLHHNVYSLQSVSIALMFCYLGMFLVLRGLNRPHKPNPVLRCLSTALIVCCVIDLITYLLIPSGISEFADVFALLIPTLLIYNRNKKIEEPEEEQKQIENTVRSNEIAIHEQRPSFEDLDLIDQAIIHYEMVQTNRFTQQNVPFLHTVVKSKICLIELKEKDYEFNSYILNQINELAKIYLELVNSRVQTAKTLDLLQKVMDSFTMVSESLENMYDQHFEQTAYSVEADIKTLESKLKTEGYFGSDFK